MLSRNAVTNQSEQRTRTLKLLAWPNTDLYEHEPGISDGGSPELHHHAKRTVSLAACDTAIAVK